MSANAPRAFWKWPKEKQIIHIFNKFYSCTQLSFLCLISGNRQFSTISKQLIEKSCRQM